VIENVLCNDKAFAYKMWKCDPLANLVHFSSDWGIEASPIIIRAVTAVRSVLARKV